MSVLDDCQAKITALLTEITRVRQSYDTAMSAYNQLQKGDAVNMTGVGMHIQLGDVQIPVPLPSDAETLCDHFAGSINFLANELARLWYEVHNTAGMAKNYVDAARTKATPPAGPINSPPQNIAPWPAGQQQAVQQPPAAPPQQRQSLPASVTLPGPVLRPPQTTPINQ